MSTITLYTAPLCPYCSQAKRLLGNKGVIFTEIDISSDSSLRQEMMNKSQRHTVPQLFNGDKHIGDCTEIHTFERHGELDALLG